MPKVDYNINIEGAVLRFKNFAGKEGKFNPRGQRNFCVLLDDDDAKRYEEDGWNIKYLEPKDPEDDVIPYMQVKVQYTDKSKPIVWMITGGNKTKLTEDEIDILDWAEITNCDLVIRPYNWGPNPEGKSGVKGYLKAMYVTIAEDKFAAKYHDVPDSAASCITGEYID